MTTQNLDKTRLRLVQQFQQDEIDSHQIYKRLSERTKDAHNSEILKKISEDELKHYSVWKKITGRELKPRRFRTMFYYLIARLLGITFSIRLMERGEQGAQAGYAKLTGVDGVDSVLQDEERHEDELVNLLHEDLLKYVSSIVLGLSDALVELTGALAGFTFALGRTDLIALAGLITGISAAFSMAASEYLSASEEASDQNPLKAALYTGFTYLVTVLILTSPYIILNALPAIYPLVVTLIIAVSIIFGFTAYISVARNVSFKGRFARMAGICVGVAFFSLVIGLAVKNTFNISV